MWPLLWWVNRKAYNYVKRVYGEMRTQRALELYC